MTKEQKQAYRSPEELKIILMQSLRGQKFRLDCGHHVTFGHSLGNDILIRNGKVLRIVCSLCGY